MHTLTCDSVLCVCVCFRAKGSGTDGVSCRERDLGGKINFLGAGGEVFLCTAQGHVLGCCVLRCCAVQFSSLQFSDSECLLASKEAQKQTSKFTL